MSEENSAAGAEITENDILFDCPYCEKSLTIDRSAEGLVIQCPDCGQDVEVPPYVPPEYVATDETVMMTVDDRVPVLEKALAVSQAKVQELVDNLAATQRRRQTLEKARVAQVELLETIGREMVVMQNALDRVTAAIAEQAEPGAVAD
ncbi:MAG: hypothetical protein K9N49_03105 [Candidatus Marinimicrobia bacterium]|nr:hypothetical protein [Candidatus Neomarinimicrobiota bacterium]